MRKGTGRFAFSLAEVVIALGICAFVLVALIGLFSNGWRSSRDSEGQIQAANFASRFLCVSSAVSSGTANPDGLSLARLTQAYGNAFSSANVFLDSAGGLSTNMPPDAAYRITCLSGTSAGTGPKVSQVYLKLSWPPQAGLTNEAGRYEVVTYVSLP